jgi:hypothetical protein
MKDVLFAPSGYSVQVQNYEARRKTLRGCPATAFNAGWIFRIESNNERKARLKEYPTV